MYVTSVGLSIIWYVPFRSDCIFLEIPFCVLKLGIKTIVPIFKSVAGIKSELIWLFIFCLCNNFFVGMNGSYHRLIHLSMVHEMYVVYV